VGGIQLRPAFTLPGKAILSDGRAIPPDMHATLSADQAWDSQFAILAAHGSFEFRGLPADFYQISPAVKRYRNPDGIAEVLVERDMSGFAIQMQPATDWR